MNKYTSRLATGLILVPVLGIWNIWLFIYLNETRAAEYNAVFSSALFAGAWLLSSRADKWRAAAGQRKLITGELMGIGFPAVFFQTDASGRFTFLDEGWEDISGIPADSAAGSHYSEYLDDETEVLLKGVLREAAKASEDLIRLECRLFHPLFGSRWVEAFIKLSYDEDGRCSGTSGLIIEAGERKVRERELLTMNERLAATSSKMSAAAQLAAGIAHEVRNPMTSILGFIKLIRDEGAGSEAYYDIIFSEIKRIDTVLNELLVLSRPSRNLFTEIGLTDITEHVATLLETNAILKGITIVRSYQAGDVRINGDENQLKQVLINLIKNAIEAMEEGEIEVHIQKYDGYAGVKITDQGIGMEKEEILKSGQPFFTTKEEGTGLGLSVSSKILESHRGKMLIASEPGKGTAVLCLFPIKD